MRIFAISLFALASLTGCIAVHAHLPEDMVRHMAREDGVEVAAVCSHNGQGFSEGASVCMEKRRMTCDRTERWVQDGAC